jgi:hypothetical protein
MPFLSSFFFTPENGCRSITEYPGAAKIILLALKSEVSGVNEATGVGDGRNKKVIQVLLKALLAFPIQAEPTHTDAVEWRQLMRTIKDMHPDTRKDVLNILRKFRLGKSSQLIVQYELITHRFPCSRIYSSHR